jgi:hypothetical protein
LTGPNPTRLKVCQGTTRSASQTDGLKPSGTEIHLASRLVG